MTLLDHDTIAALDALNEDGEPDVVIEIVSLFLADVPGRLQAIHAAAGAADAAALRCAAHALKGSAGNVGATALREACLAIEQQAVAGRVDDGLVRTLVDVAPQTEAALRLLVAERAAA